MIILADFTSLTACLQLLIVMQIFVTLSCFSCPLKNPEWPPAELMKRWIFLFGFSGSVITPQAQFVEQPLKRSQQ